MNLVEKIVHRFAVHGGKTVRSGDFLTIQPHHVMTHDNTGAVISKFGSIGATRFKEASQPVFTLDHDIQNTSPTNLTKYENIERFASKHGIDFYPAGRGIGHQIMIEEGYAYPYTMTVASDSHSNMYGGIGALGTPIVRTDAAAIWATGKTWWQIPPVVKVELSGSLPKGRSGKDVIIALCGIFNNDQVLNAAIEFHGDGIQSLSLDDRLTIANMTTEWGALAGVFPVDKITLDWLWAQSLKLQNDVIQNGSFTNSQTVPSLVGKKVHPRHNEARIAQLEKNLLQPDEDAVYSKHLTLDLSSLSDHVVAGPNSVKLTKPVAELEKKNITVHKAYLLSCTNSRASDIKSAADVFRKAIKENDGRPVKVASGVEFYVAPASSKVQQESEIHGDWQVLMNGGAIALPAGCGPCIGLGAGLLRDGEVGISATNRNFTGRMGSRKADAYLSSPAVVAASAISGKICGPTTLAHTEGRAFALQASVKLENVTLHKRTTAVGLINGFPKTITGELIFCPVNNLNTDGIYAGKHTYNDGMSPKQMAAVVMENYDPHFAQLVKKGDILVSGYNFGSGSSREQAATSLKYAGIQLVLAASFSETFKRNALNNALICLEAKELYNDLDHSLTKSSRPLTSRTTIRIEFEADSGIIYVKNCPEFYSLKSSYAVAPIGKIAQELVVEGGLETWVKNRIK